MVECAHRDHDDGKTRIYDVVRTPDGRLHVVCKECLPEVADDVDPNSPERTRQTGIWAAVRNRLAWG